MKPKLPLLAFGLLLAVSALLSSGCATIVRGTKDTLVVESEPSGATVRLSNGMVGKTPTSFKLPRKENLIVTIERDGYETLTVNVNSQVSGAGAAGMAGNVLVGGLIGAVVDPLSGAMKDLKPNPVRATLVPLRKAETVAASAPPAPSPAAAPIPVAVSAPEPAPQPAATSEKTEEKTATPIEAAAPPPATTASAP